MRVLPMTIALAALGLACHYDLDAVDRPGDDGGGDLADASGADGAAVADPCEVDEVPAAVHLHGRVLDAADSAAIASVTVDAVPGGNTLSAADGSFAIDVSLGGAPRAISVSFDTQEDVVYPLHLREFQRPFDRADVDVQPRLHSYDQLDATTLHDYQDNPNRDPGAATVVTWLFDCDDAGVAGATIAVNPSPDAISYFGGGTSTDSTGVAYALNVPAGTVTVTATGSEPFTFEAPAGSVVVAQVVAP